MHENSSIVHCTVCILGMDNDDDDEDDDESDGDDDDGARRTFPYLYSFLTSHFPISFPYPKSHDILPFIHIISEL